MQRRALVVLFLTLLLVMTSFGIIIPNLAYYAEELQASSTQIGWLMATYSLFQFVFSPLWGRFSDRYGRRPAILIGLVGNAGGLLLFGMADTLWVLFIARAVSGALTAAALPTCMAYVADVTDEKSRGRGMAWMGAAMGMGFILGPPVGGILGGAGHNLPFFLAAGVTVATALFAAFALPESLHRKEAMQGTWNLAPKRWARSPLLPYFLLAFFATMTMAGLETTFPLLVRDVLGLGSVSLGWMLAIMGLAVALFQGGLLGRLIQRHGEETVLMAGLLTNAAGFFFIASAVGPTSMTVYLTVAGVGNQILRPTNAALISKRTTGGQGFSIGIMDSMDSLGRVVGPFIAGSLFGVKESLPYYFGALVLSLVFVGLGVTRRPAKEPA